MLFECSAWFGYLAVDTIDFLELAEQQKLDARVANLQALLDENGLEGMLQKIVDNADIGYVLDNRTLINIERNGTTLSYLSEVNEVGEAALDTLPSLQTIMLKNVCNQSDGYGFLVRAGATIEITFVSTDGTELLDVSATLSDCGL